MKDVQATGEALRPQKKASSSSKHEFFLHVFYLCGVIFALPDPNLYINADPVPTDPDPLNTVFPVVKYFCSVYRPGWKHGAVSWAAEGREEGAEETHADHQGPGHSLLAHKQVDIMPLLYFGRRNFVYSIYISDI